MRTVCDVRELPDRAALAAWAKAHRTKVRYLGPTLEDRPVYGATHGVATRVAREEHPDPHPRPLVWESPLEHLDEPPGTAHNAVVAVGIALISSPRGGNTVIGRIQEALRSAL